ncbi:hemerythrin domain-containing protein [Pseudokineococcus sp. 5B2Z-1]|uniref:hemerythrin domain-containing protein n=1 Tax=Pseudokineococcus sp. 5B2Z-1 TaxID=3132744 RepID=UPI00309DFE08
MSTTTPPVAVTPRRPGEPVVDLLHLRVIHQVLLRDAHRLTALADDVAAGTEVLDRRRATALARYVDKSMTSIHHHHAAEDDLLWPVIVGSAGDAVDLDELSDDHSVLDPRMDRVRAAARALAASPRSEDAATALAVRLADLRDLLVEHMADEERTIFPVMEEHVSVADWQRVMAGVARRDSDLGFVLPRIADTVEPEVMAVLLAEAGPVMRVLLALVRPRHRRFERLVFGRAA